VGPVVSEVGVFRQHGVTRFAAPIASGNPNTIGAVLFTSILLTLGLMMTKEWSISRGGLLLAVQGTALIGTISRTSWVSLLAALVFLTLATTRRMSGIVLRLVVLAICSAVVVVLLANTGAVIQAVEWTTNH